MIGANQRRRINPKNDTKRRVVFITSYQQSHSRCRLRTRGVAFDLCACDPVRGTSHANDGRNVQPPPHEQSIDGMSVERGVHVNEGICERRRLLLPRCSRCCRNLRAPGNECSVVKHPVAESETQPPGGRANASGKAAVGGTRERVRAGERSWCSQRPGRSPALAVSGGQRSDWPESAPGAPGLFPGCAVYQPEPSRDNPGRSEYRLELRT